MKATKGHSHDARVNKKLRVILFLVEALGGICGRARRQCYALAERASGAGATDRTRYGKVRGAARRRFTCTTRSRLPRRR